MKRASWFMLLLTMVGVVLPPDVRTQEPVQPPTFRSTVQLSVADVSAVRFGNEPEVWVNITYEYRTVITRAVSTLPWALEDEPVRVLAMYAPGTQELEQSTFFEIRPTLPGYLTLPETKGYWDWASFTGIMATTEEWNQWTLTLSLPGAQYTTVWGCVRVRSFDNLIDAPEWMPDAFWRLH